MTTIGVVCFPGSNCEHDVVQAVSRLGGSARLLWHGDHELGDVDGVVVPGGFAHGDYLRPGAIARFSPIMNQVIEFAEGGGPVLGICNGFQVLTESGLLPGALMRNEGLRFICDTVTCEVISTHTVLTSRSEIGSMLRLPINHYQGNFTCDSATLAEIEAAGQVFLRYRDNPNGSMNAIAGVANTKGNVVGLMPHPERASSELLGSCDGIVLLQSFVDAANDRATATATATATAIASVA